MFERYLGALSRRVGRPPPSARPAPPLCRRLAGTAFGRATDASGEGGSATEAVSAKEMERSGPAGKATEICILLFQSQTNGDHQPLAVSLGVLWWLSVRTG